MLLSLLISSVLIAATDQPQSGYWRAWLDCPGGELPFGLWLEKAAGNAESAQSQPVTWRGQILNDTERIEIPRVSIVADELWLEMSHYDSRIQARVLHAGKRLEGFWVKRRGQDRFSKLAFYATYHDEREPAPRFKSWESAGSTSVANFGGRWAVRFGQSEDLAVGVFKQSDDYQLTGTFLTTLGDYRFLAGQVAGATMRLSCFDGAHAFLFHASMLPGGELQGDFWSSAHWHETWKASRNADIELADSFEQTVWTGDQTTAALEYPDLNGELRSLRDEFTRGKVQILQIFGSWCPNCHDEGAYLGELQRRYQDRGLNIVGLAFELTDDLERNTEQLRRFQKLHQADYRILIAGPSDKAEATKALPVVDRIRSYPTTIFMDHRGRVRAVHSGFSGPATGDAHKKLRHKFEVLLESLFQEAEEQNLNFPGHLQSMTPVLLVESIEPCLDFWMRRLGFQKTAEVLEGQELGFVLLQREGVEIMLQSRKSMENDLPQLGSGKFHNPNLLYLRVADLQPFLKALEGVPVVQELRRTDYGAQEIFVRGPAGNVLGFAAFDRSDE